MSSALCGSVEASAELHGKSVSVPLACTMGVAGAGPQPVAFGAPLERGSIRQLAARATLVSPEGREFDAHVAPLSRWADGSVQWMQVDALMTISAESPDAWTLIVEESASGDAQASEAASLACAALGDAFRLDRALGAPTTVPYRDVVAAVLSAVSWRLRDRKGRVALPALSPPRVAESGPIQTTIIQEGSWATARGLQLEVRWTLYGAAGIARCDVTLRNSKAARHRRSLWDLGDARSFRLRDFSFILSLPQHASRREIAVRVTSDDAWRTAERQALVYQDSSGGDNWQSRAHVNADGEVRCRFPGYESRVDDRVKSGRRAQPQASAAWGDDARVTVAIPEFWQQFPKALEGTPDHIRVGLFPGEFDDLHELQGGEQKTHTLWLKVAPPSSPEHDLAWIDAPAIFTPVAAWCALAAATPALAIGPTARHHDFETVLSEALDGPRSILAHRERVDEYGWRHFGDMFADHEQAYYRGAEPQISHYNNQFDMVLGFLWQYLRTTDRRWFDLADALARHVIDIDVYHTTRDRAAYSGGMFWFTDHYLTAHTSTHRSYSRKNKPANGADYGGGPGAEHNFTSGLTLYHFLTGSVAARATVLGLAQWVVRMEDGQRTILGVLDDGPTGLATANKAGPGRGGANSINALLDAWLLTRDPAYLSFAEGLIRRCVHPDDAVEQLNLHDVEKHWSYTMFLSTLGKYLRCKEEAGQLNGAYAYARRSLMRYARWMADHERPYFDQTDNLEFPTEAWAAQELRKANVFRAAAPYAEDDFVRAELQAKGDAFGDRAWSDLMRFSQTRMCARALALVMTEGLLDCAARGATMAPAPPCGDGHNFAAKADFSPQRTRVQRKLTRPATAIKSAARVLNPARWLAWSRRYDEAPEN